MPTELLTVSLCTQGNAKPYSRYDKVNANTTGLLRSRFSTLLWHIYQVDSLHRASITLPISLNLPRTKGDGRLTFIIYADIPRSQPIITDLELRECAFSGLPTTLTAQKPNRICVRRCIHTTLPARLICTHNSQDHNIHMILWRTNTRARNRSNGKDQAAWG